jgi:hypothetical protein
MKKLDLGCGCLGNGITVWNRAVEVRGDYKKMAHVGANGEVTYYIKRIPEELKNMVDKLVNEINSEKSNLY